MQISLNGVWGTVPRSAVNEDVLLVVCKQLGLESLGSVPGSVLEAGLFGPGSGPIWSESITCDPTEHEELKDCSILWGMAPSGNNAAHASDAAIECRFPGRQRAALSNHCTCLVEQSSIAAAGVRLANASADGRSGRLEVLHNTIWGTVGRLAGLTIVCKAKPST